jgi:hypothetical protein
MKKHLVIMKISSLPPTKGMWNNCFITFNNYKKNLNVIGTYLYVFTLKGVNRKIFLWNISDVSVPLTLFRLIKKTADMTNGRQDHCRFIVTNSSSSSSPYSTKWGWHSMFSSFMLFYHSSSACSLFLFSCHPSHSPSIFS